MYLEKKVHGFNFEQKRGKLKQVAFEDFKWSFTCFPMKKSLTGGVFLLCVYTRTTDLFLHVVRLQFERKKASIFFDSNFSLSFTILLCNYDVLRQTFSKPER